MYSTGALRCEAQASKGLLYEERMEAFVEDRVMDAFKEEINYRNDRMEIAEHCEDNSAEVCAEPSPATASILSMFPEIQAVAFDFIVPEASPYPRKAKRALLDAKRTSLVLVLVLGSLLSSEML